MLLKTPVKFDQICFATMDSVKAVKQYTETFGLKSEKTVFDPEHIAQGMYKGQPATWHLNLAYCYPMPGLEVEFLQFVAGLSFHKQLKEGELSHLGTHVVSCSQFVLDNPALEDKVLLEGELWKGKRGWCYVYFDTVEELGFRLKIIERMNRE